MASLRHSTEQSVWVMDQNTQYSPERSPSWSYRQHNSRGARIVPGKVASHHMKQQNFFHPAFLGLDRLLDAEDEAAAAVSLFLERLDLRRLLERVS